MRLRLWTATCAALVAMAANAGAYAGEAAKPVDKPAGHTETTPAKKNLSTAASSAALAEEPVSQEATAAPAGEVAHFGAALSETEPTPLATVLTAPDGYTGKTVVLEGVIADVCQNKGCWMTLQHEGQEMRVRFKDYAFFVPKDCSGKTARIEGVFEVKDVPVDEARHYLEDAGKKDEAAKITAPVKSFTFMASGVELR